MNTTAKEQGSDRISVLHITECLGGGVTGAIESYAANSPQFDHHLFAWLRDRDLTGAESCLPVVSYEFAQRNALSLIALKRCLQRVQPSVVHLHSTFAGILRALPIFDSKRVIYTPHGFSFLREGRLRWLYHSIESLLSRRTRVIAGCGREEALLASGLRRGMDSVELRNVSSKASLPGTVREDRTWVHPTVGMVGRISAQKGVDFFADVAEQLGNRVKWVWIGGGDPAMTKQLTRAGVRVTGWINHDQVLAELGNLDIYFHSAAWDGFPISVLEAASFRLPLILRSIPPFDLEGLRTCATPTDVVRLIESILAGDHGAIAAMSETSESVRNYHDPAYLKQALDEIYTLAGS